MRPYNHVWLSHRGRCALLATLKELRLPSPGLRAKLATLGKRPTNLATLTELRLAVGVTCNVFSLILEYTTTKRYKKICGFSGLCPMRPCVLVNISRACSRIFPATPIRACPVAGKKAANTKSPPLAVKKVRLRRYKKMITLFSIGSRHIDGIHKLLFFYRQRRSFFTAAGRFLNRGGCCRHAAHGVGGEGGVKEENSFSDWRHYQLQ